MNRVQRIAQHVAAADTPESPLRQCPTAATFTSQGAAKADDDVVICCSVRTAVGKASKGGFKDTPAEEMLVPLFHEIVKRTGVKPSDIGDCQIGNVLQPGAGAAGARVAQMMAGWPIEVPVVTVNRQCSSGIQTVANIASGIRAGVYDVGLAGGVESMSYYRITSGIDEKKMSEEVRKNELSAACLLSMGITSENVAAKWGISREKQDKMAVDSHNKAIAAQKAGLFDSEIVPIKTVVKDKKTGAVKEVTVSADEGCRGGLTVESLGKLKPAFKEGGSTTAGNASQLSDGASLVLVARRSKAKELGLPILGRFRSYAVVGVDPNLMGIGPAFAIPPALEKAGVKVEDIDIWEINEAFASQATMSVEHLKIPMEKVNPKGGGIALGHPLGATGARQLSTLLPELKRTGKKMGVVSMCIGSGMGAAAVIESEQ